MSHIAFHFGLAKTFQGCGDRATRRPESSDQYSFVYFCSE